MKPRPSHTHKAGIVFLLFVCFQACDMYGDEEIVTISRSILIEYRRDFEELNKLIEKKISEPCVARSIMVSPTTDFFQVTEHTYQRDFDRMKIQLIDIEDSVEQAIQEIVPKNTITRISVIGDVITVYYLDRIRNRHKTYAKFVHCSNWNLFRKIYPDIDLIEEEPGVDNFLDDFYLLEDNWAITTADSKLNLSFDECMNRITELDPP